MKIPISTRKLTASLESALIIWYRPTFLHITPPDEDNDIQIIIASDLFIHRPVQGRIKTVMTTIDLYAPEIYDDRLVIIQAYTPEEMDEILEYVFKE